MIRFKVLRGCGEMMMEMTRHFPRAIHFVLAINLISYHFRSNTIFFTRQQHQLFFPFSSLALSLFDNTLDLYFYFLLYISAGYMSGRRSYRREITSSIHMKIRKWNWFSSSSSSSLFFVGMAVIVLPFFSLFFIFVYIFHPLLDSMHKAEIAQVADGCDLNEKVGVGWDAIQILCAATHWMEGFFSHFLTNLLIQYLTE